VNSEESRSTTEAIGGVSASISIMSGSYKINGEALPGGLSSPGMKKAKAVLYTVGHSTRSLAELAAALRAHGVRQVLDVRTVPKSRHNPQFNKAALGKALRARRINYRHLKALGGLRHARKDSTLNAGWRNASFRGYADYMQTAEFDAGLKELAGVAAKKPTAVMCAEAVPWRCHRSMIADAWTARGGEARHIMSPANARLHKLNPMARVRKGRVTYPASTSGVYRPRRAALAQRAR
jgi:hypothetical protein